MQDGSHDTGGACSVLVREGREGCDELPHMHGCLGFVAHEVHGLEASVVIYEYEGVLIAAVHCAHEGTSYVSVHKSASVRWLVKSALVRKACGIGLGAGGTSVKPAESESRWRIRSDRRERAAASEGDMTSMWCDVLNAWMARQRPRLEESLAGEGGRVATRLS
eukprot:6212164-Pleurochrysis_carterae.AAC.1